jgi:hypothetical protein
MSFVYLDRCKVIQTSVGVTVEFFDGSTIDGTPHDTPHYYLVSNRTGYGDDIFKFCVEHDLFHAWVYQYFKGQVSPIQWALAHDNEMNPFDAMIEELLVQTCQVFIRGNVRPSIGSIDWDHFKIATTNMLDRFYNGEL